MSARSQRELVDLSRYIDDSYPDRLGAEEVDWRRIAKITEETGEVTAAYLGAIGENPRKGTTHTITDVEHELLDVATAALGALEHLRGHLGDSMRLLDDHISGVAARAGLL